MPAHQLKSIKNNLTLKFQEFLRKPDTRLLASIAKGLYSMATHHESAQELKKILLFTERELACLCFLVRGFSAKQIAQYLKISPRTVEVFIDRMKKKLEFSCKSQLIDWFWGLMPELQ